MRLSVIPPMWRAPAFLAEIGDSDALKRRCGSASFS